MHGERKSSLKARMNLHKIDFLDILQNGYCDKVIKEFVEDYWHIYDHNNLGSLNKR